MRITNKIMQNNSLNNINNNKIMQDKLQTQMATQLKITRPSDDPVIAIRALRLRTSLSEITQYYEKNVPDAESWLEVTEAAVNSLTTILKNMYIECEKGIGDELPSDARAAILKNLKQLRDEVYATGDADYDGRTVFTGYRTESKLLFQTATTQQYGITEQFNKKKIDSLTYVDTGSLKDVNNINYNDPNATTEQEVTTSTINRIRLSYDNLSLGITPQIQVPTGVLDADGNMTYGPLQVNGAGLVPTVMHVPGVPDPYTAIANNPDAAYFIPETGEMLLGTNVNAAMQALSDSSEIRISYEKSEWDKGDLRPEHYFACTANSFLPPNDPKQIQYNPEYLQSTAQDNGKQNIAYDVGFNQSIQVNTLAGECFTHNIGRDVDELVKTSQAVTDMEKVVKNLEAMQGNSALDQTKVSERLLAAQKALHELKTKEHDLYASTMTSMQSYSAEATLAQTNIGSRDSRLALIKNRLQSQQANFKELEAQNEGIEITDVAIELDSMEMSYNAALMSIGKIVQNSLMDFI